MSKKGKSEAIMTAAGMTRKILRFGPSITLIRTIINNLISLIKAGLLSQIITYGLQRYFYLYLKVKLAHNKKIQEWCEFLGALGWLLDCLTCLVKNYCMYMGMINNRERQSQDQRKKKLKSLIIDTIRLILDIPVAFYFTFPGKINGKIAGLLGTITSIIGIYQMWPNPPAVKKI